MKFLISEESFLFVRLPAREAQDTMLETQLLQWIFLLLNIALFLANQIEQKILTNAEVITILH